jgi:hypothetical protein
MKIRFLLFCGVLLGPMVALSRGGPASILVSTVTRPASAGKDSQAIADYFESQVVKMLLDKYPCAQPLTASDVHGLLDWERQRDLLVSDADADLTAIAGSVGAKYVISLTVTELGSGQLSLQASMMNGTDAQTQARGGTVTSGGDAALDAVEATAKQFVDGLSSLSQFSKAKCNPTNHWTGTITYHLAEKKNETTEGTVVGLTMGTATTTLITSNNYDVTIHIGWTGRPQATIIANNSSNTEEVAKIQIDCGRSSLVHTPVWKSAGWRHVTLWENTASGSCEASVSVTLANGRFQISMDVPEVEGKMKITQRKHFDGGCAKPTDDNPDPMELPWKIKRSLPVIDRPLGKPGELKGGDTDAFGGTVTWNLTQTPMRD